MKKKMKIGRNDLCPCGNLKKYKNCCEGKVAWNQIFRKNSPTWKDHLSPRGRNLLFLERLYTALKLNKEPTPKSISDFKAAFTPAISP